MKAAGSHQGFPASELGIVLVERVVEHRRGIGTAEASEGVAPPASQMRGVEGEVGPVVEPVGSVAEKIVGGVERVQAGLGLLVGGECFAVRGGEPGPQQQSITRKAKREPSTARSAEGI